MGLCRVGESLRGVALIGAVLRKVNLLLILKSAALALNARDKTEGERGDEGAFFGDLLLWI